MHPPLQEGSERVLGTNSHTRLLRVISQEAAELIALIRSLRFGYLVQTEAAVLSFEIAALGRVFLLPPTDLDVECYVSNHVFVSFDWAYQRLFFQCTSERKD